VFHRNSNFDTSIEVHGEVVGKKYCITQGYKYQINKEQANLSMPSNLREIF
jgi:hypothetical protein